MLLRAVPRSISLHTCAALGKLPQHGHGCKPEPGLEVRCTQLPSSQSFLQGMTWLTGAAACAVCKLS